MAKWREKYKKKAKNLVIRLDEEGGLQQVEDESLRTLRMAAMDL